MSVQYMFLNYNEDPLTIEIRAYETVRIYKLEPSGSPLETQVGAPHVPDEPPGYVIFNMVIPAGTVYGFHLQYTPVFDDLQREGLLVLTAASKDPWPDPPPTKPAAYSEGTWAARYADFLYALSGERQKQPAAHAKPADPAKPAGPAKPAEPSAST